MHFPLHPSILIYLLELVEKLSIQLHGDERFFSLSRLETQIKDSDGKEPWSNMLLVSCMPDRVFLTESKFRRPEQRGRRLGISRI